jgi:hypothetical protein
MEQYGSAILQGLAFVLVLGYLPFLSYFSNTGKKTTI